MVAVLTVLASPTVATARPRIAAVQYDAGHHEIRVKVCARPGPYGLKVRQRLYDGNGDVFAERFLVASGRGRAHSRCATRRVYVPPSRVLTGVGEFEDRFTLEDSAGVAAVPVFRRWTVVD